MKEIVILSGKGGTGKTSVAAALSVLAGKDAVIADCDVDASNMHLMLAPDYANTTDFYGGNEAIININKCNNCGDCVKICRFDAINNYSGSFEVSSLNCEGCGYCMRICPNEAITLKQRFSGKLFISAIRTNTTMVHAKLAIGAENSGKLVAAVKRKANEIAFTSDKKFIITDGSPGIGCPVVSSLSGAAFVLLVTEPTLSASHDLKRVIELIKAFSIPSGCIINKHNINTTQTLAIIEYLKKEKIEHLGSIPFDNCIASDMSRAITMAESNEVLRKKINEIWKKVKLKIEKS